MEGRPETAILAALSKSSEDVGNDLSKFSTDSPFDSSRSMGSVEVEMALWLSKVREEWKGKY